MNNIVVWIKQISSSGSYIDVAAEWFADNGICGEFTATGISFSQNPSDTLSAIKTAFANEANSKVEPPGTLTEGNVLVI